MPAEMSLVDRVLKTLISCGRSVTVVSVAPINPRAIIKSADIMHKFKSLTNILLFPISK
jgi:hypothetical protein